MTRFISKMVEVSGYEDVDISIEEIIEEADEKAAKQIIIGLIKKFPRISDIVMNATTEAAKLYPKGLKSELIEKHTSENQSIERFTQTQEVQ